MRGRLALVHIFSLLALCAGFLLLGMDATQNEGQKPGGATDALTAYRTQREVTRARLIEALTPLCGDANDAVAGDAARLLLEFARRTETETALEGMLRARGFADACASVRPGSVNLLVRGEVSPAQAAVLMELALRETGESPGSVRIVPVG